MPESTLSIAALGSAADAAEEGGAAMRGQIKTLADAKAYRYGCWAGNQKGHAYDPRTCAEEFIPNERGGLPRQCNQRPLRGGIFCATHDPKRRAAKVEAGKNAEAARRADEEAIRRQAKDLSTALGVEGHPDFIPGSLRYVRRLVITFEDAADLVRRLKRGER